MSYTVNDLGLWTPYIPEPFPIEAPENAMFCKREGDGVDWYAFSRNAMSWQPDSLKASCLPTPGGYVVQAIYRDERKLFPQNCRLIEILRVPSDIELPHKLFEQKVVNLITSEFTEQTPPAVVVVSAAQAKTALYNAGLLPYVKAIIDAYDYEPVRIFYENASNWEIENPYVQAIAIELNLNAIQLQILFDKAAKL